MVPGEHDDTVSAKVVRKRSVPPDADRVRDRPDVGRYRLTAYLGAGGMGVVYRGRDPTLERELAIKLVRPRRAGADARARFLREAQAMAKLQHGNVVPIFDVGTVDDDIFLVMPYLSGGTLRQWLRDEARTWRAVVERFVAAGRGLAAAHEAGLVHRDFKPDNVLIGPKGDVQVADFGLARIGEEDIASARTSAPGEISDDLTRTGDVLGTPAYMAPEQLAGEAVDARADQFAFCVSLYEAVYGQRPFDALGAEGVDALAVLYRQVVDGHVRPAPPDRPVPPWLRQAVLRGLRPEPANRWPSMAALVAHLEEQLGRASVEPDPTLSAMAAPAAPSTIPVRRAPRWPYLAGAVAAAAALAIALLFFRTPARRGDVRGASDTALATRCDGKEGAACAELAARALRDLDGPPDFARVHELALRACDRDDARGCAQVAWLLATGNGLPPDLSRARELATTACDGGSYDGCDILGDLAERGLGGPIDGAVAVATYQKSCDLGSPDGCAAAARRLRLGLGVTADPAAADALDARAFPLADAGCERGDPAACRVRGLLAFRGQGVAADQTRGAADLVHACALGSPDACGDAGQLYVIGTGIQPDATEGVRLLRRGCEGGSFSACEALITVLESGGPYGVRKDDVEARRLAERECDRRGDPGCSPLATLYSLGIGVPRDLARVTDLEGRACRGGDPGACFVSAGLQKHHDPAGAEVTYHRACDLGSSLACVELGEHAYDAKDDATALTYFKLACDMDDGASCAPLGRLYFDGRVVPLDPAGGRALYEKSCAAGDPTGCDRLAVRLRDGKGLPADLHAAEDLFEKGCRLNWGESCAAAADLLTNGGLPADPTRAAELRQKACDARPDKYCPK